MRKDRKLTRQPARRRIRGKISGTEQRPRVAVYRSIKNITLQAIDDSSGQTLAQCSSLNKELVKKAKSSGTVAAATEVGNAMAKALKDKGIETIVFDRGGFIYHGRVKAAAEALRKAGLKF